jgi:hypothetical protein
VSRQSMPSNRVNAASTRSGNRPAQSTQLWRSTAPRWRVRAPDLASRAEGRRRSARRAPNSRAWYAGPLATSTTVGGVRPSCRSPTALMKSTSRETSVQRRCRNSSARR